MRWFCSFKAYGDLVIACNSLRRKNDAQNGLLVGSHLLPLLNAIEYTGPFLALDVGMSVPAIFDIKKCGYGQAILSALSLRRQIRSAVPKQDTLIYDSLGARQRFLASSREIKALDHGAENIYLDYAHFLGLNDLSELSRMDGHAAGNVFVFPDSRIKEKEMPDELVRQIAETNARLGKRTTIVKVGTPTPLPQYDGLDTVWVDGFDPLVKTIRSADAIVSADSLPGHVAEYFSLPVFVFTPKPNHYWMPLSSFVNENFTNFHSFGRYEAWIASK